MLTHFRGVVPRLFGPTLNTSGVVKRAMALLWCKPSSELVVGGVWINSALSPPVEDGVGGRGDLWNLIHPIPFGKTTPVTPVTLGYFGMKL